MHQHDPDAIRALLKRGVVSIRAASRYAYDATSSDGKRLTRDEGSSRSRGEIPTNELDHPTNQGGSAAYGRRVSNSGGAGRERGEGSGHINDKRNRREFPRESRVSKRNADAHWLAKYSSVSRSKRSSANEWHPGAWYGDPTSRQE